MVSFWTACPASSLFSALEEARAPLEISLPELERSVRWVPSFEVETLPTNKMEAVC